MRFLNFLPHLHLCNVITNSTTHYFGHKLVDRARFTRIGTDMSYVAFAFGYITKMGNRKEDDIKFSLVKFVLCLLKVIVIENRSEKYIHLKPDNSKCQLKCHILALLA